MRLPTTHTHSFSAAKNQAVEARKAAPVLEVGVEMLEKGSLG